MKRIKKLFSGIKSSVKSEKAENTITMIIMFPLLWAIIMTIIDFGCYFNNRSLLIQDLRDGARTVAILGGTNNELSQAYGVQSTTDSVASACSASDTDLIMHGYESDQVTKAVKNKICSNKGYVNYSVYDIQCGPKTTKSVGQAVWCQADYVYNGMPGSVMSLLGPVFRSMSGYIDESVTQTNGAESMTISDTGANGKTELTTKSGSMGWNGGTLRAAAQAETITN